VLTFLFCSFAVSFQTNGANQKLCDGKMYLTLSKYYLLKCIGVYVCVRRTRRLLTFLFGSFAVSCQTNGANQKLCDGRMCLTLFCLRCGKLGHQAIYCKAPKQEHGTGIEQWNTRI